MCLPKCGITDYPSMPKPVTLHYAQYLKVYLQLAAQQNFPKLMVFLLTQAALWPMEVFHFEWQPADNWPTTNRQPNDNWPTTNQQPTDNWPTTKRQPTDNWPTTNRQPNDNWPTTNQQPTDNWPTTKRQPTDNWPTTNQQPTDKSSLFHYPVAHQNSTLLVIAHDCLNAS